MAAARRFRRTAVAAALAPPLTAPPLPPPHGRRNYGSAEASVTAAVGTPASLAGPHATMRIRADGQVWNIVLSAGHRVAAAGLKEGMIPLGAQVTAEGHRHRDAKVYEVKTERLKWNGRTFNVYPDRS